MRSPDKYIIQIGLCYVAVFACGAFLFAAGCTKERPALSIHAVKADGCILDGIADEPFWSNASWVGLYGTNFPDEDQTHQKQCVPDICGAAAWNDDGLFFAIRAKDSDVQGNKKVDGDWIWIEDVLEVFIASANTPGIPHAEFQVNPAGTRYFNYQAGISTIPVKGMTNEIPYKVVVHVDGTLNDSSKLDNSYSAEWFFSWKDLIKAGLVEKTFKPKYGKIPCYIRFASWDLSIYSPKRINRWTLPGDANPHETANYRPLILDE